MKASERLRALDEAAAPRPWERATAHNVLGDGPIIKNSDDFDWVAIVQVSNVSNWRENAQLIAALRNALPELVAVVEAAEGGYSVDDGEGDTFTACGACHHITWRGHADDCPLVALAAKLNPGEGA